MFDIYNNFEEIKYTYAERRFRLKILDLFIAKNMTKRLFADMMSNQYITFLPLHDGTK